MQEILSAKGTKEVCSLPACLQSWGCGCGCAQTARPRRSMASLRVNVDRGLLLECRGDLHRDVPLTYHPAT